MEDSKGIKSVAVAGSFRRRKETVGDLDILVFIKKGSDVMHRFTAYEDVRKVVANGKTRSTVVLKSGLQVDVRVLSADSYGAGLHYFTGSKAHNIAVRKIGMKKKLRINEYGVFSGKKRVAGKTEKEVYAKRDGPGSKEARVYLPCHHRALPKGHGNEGPGRQAPGISDRADRQT